MSIYSCDHQINYIGSFYQLNKCYFNSLFLIADCFINLIIWLSVFLGQSYFLLTLPFRMPYPIVNHVACGFVGGVKLRFALFVAQH